MTPVVIAMLVALQGAQDTEAAIKGAADAIVEAAQSAENTLIVEHCARRVVAGIESAEQCAADQRDARSRISARFDKAYRDQRSTDPVVKAHANRVITAHTGCALKLNHTVNQVAFDVCIMDALDRNIDPTPERYRKN